jgi:hypothetical protein
MVAARHVVAAAEEATGPRRMADVFAARRRLRSEVDVDAELGGGRAGARGGERRDEGD